MKTSELIEILQKLPQDIQVWRDNDYGICEVDNAYVEELSYCGIKKEIVIIE